MTRHIINEDNAINVTGAPGFSLPNGDEIVISRWGYITATGSSANGIMAAGKASITVYGAVGSIDDTAISAVNGPTTTTIGSGGIVYGSLYGMALGNGSATVQNGGTIANGKNWGCAILYSSPSSAEGLTVFNSGEILGATGSGNGVGAIWAEGFGADTVVNTGRIRGNVSLGDGNDLYFGKGGTVEGIIDLGFGDNQAYGGAGSETFTALTGNDTIDGGDGIDTFTISEVALTLDLSVTGPQNTGLGMDVIRNIENIVSGIGSDKLTGNALANVFDSKSGFDTLDGGGGDDQLFGGTGDDKLFGGEGNDTLDGGQGNDTVDGGAGYDTVTFRDAETLNRAVTLDLSNPSSPGNTYGADTYINVEAFLGTKLGDTFTGDALGNLFDGAAGNDTLRGGGGDDTLIGGAGADRMEGGVGNDKFYVDNAGDVVVEIAGGGVDEVVASISYALTDQVENLSAAATGALTLTGNGLDNNIKGNAANNVLNGGAGADTLDGGAGADHMLGGSGNDTYHVDNTGDVVTEVAAGDGLDTVIASVSFTLGAFVENLTGSGASSLTLTGNTLDNVITGGSGHDTLYGGQGKDTLTGGAGKDTFVFDTRIDKTKTQVDLITDFNVKDDGIWLDNAIFRALGKKGTPANPVQLKKDAFWIGAKAHDKSDRIIYDLKKGALYYDSDGSGKAAAILIATLPKGLKTLSEKDFFVI
ncbi:calcium-binding protein [Microvirga alba]|uniref:Calcium-binding protein n=1 Tax=Microvirga alba TaxID=2791025 RepID=A0A931BUH0_9HYPH|nr:calcium-binding protein [Microvirga alba]MBF9233057.1 calcium-binding protein [Microvirga alba]